MHTVYTTSFVHVNIFYLNIKRQIEQNNQNKTGYIAVLNAEMYYDILLLLSNIL